MPLSDYTLNETLKKISCGCGFDVFFLYDDRRTCINVMHQGTLIAAYPMHGLVDTYNDAQRSGWILAKMTYYLSQRKYLRCVETWANAEQALREAGVEF